MQLASPTLLKLITNVRNFLNSPNPANSFWTDAELTEYLNEAVRQYFAEVVMNNEGLFAATPVLLNLVANTETVALPDDFYEVRALYKVVNNGYLLLPYLNDVTSNFVSNGVTADDAYMPAYHFQGNNLVLRPPPGNSQTGALRLEYIQFPDTMINGGDALTSQVSPVFKQLIEMYAVYKSKLKESLVNGTDMHSVAATNLNQIYTVFRESIMNRSKYPQFVVPFNPEGSW